MKVVGITGMPGAGKSEAVAVARQQGIPVVRMGDLIWEEVDRQGLPRDAANVGQVADSMRTKGGDDVWAQRTVERIKEVHAGARMVIVDGIRSHHEVGVFRDRIGSDFVLVGIHTDPNERHARMTRRGRDDDPDDEAGHDERDQREMNWGLARTIAMADEMVVNDETLEAFHAEFAGLLDELRDES